MAMMRFLRERRSVRDFENKKLTSDDISNIQNAITEISGEFGWNDIKVNFVENGEEVFNEYDKRAGYEGVMISAPSYIRLNYTGQDKITNLKGAFVIGELITRLVDLGLGSCVITVDEEKVLGQDQTSDDTDYLIAVGYKKAVAPFAKEPFSTRKPVEEVVFLDENFTKPANEKLKDLNMLDLFSALIHAPSYKNKQPWKFLLKEGEVLSYVENDGDINHSLTDMGIIMYYFQQMAKTMGIRGNWEIVSDLNPIGNYIKLGRFKI